MNDFTENPTFRDLLKENIELREKYIEELKKSVKRIDKNIESQEEIIELKNRLIERNQETLILIDQLRIAVYAMEKVINNLYYSPSDRKILNDAFIEMEKKIPK